MTVGMVMTVWHIKTAHRQNLSGTVIMSTVITLSPMLLVIFAGVKNASEYGGPSLLQANY